MAARASPCSWPAVSATRWAAPAASLIQAAAGETARCRLCQAPVAVPATLPADVAVLAAAARTWATASAPAAEVLAAGVGSGGSRGTGPVTRAENRFSCRVNSTRRATPPAAKMLWLSSTRSMTHMPSAWPRPSTSTSGRPLPASARMASSWPRPPRHSGYRMPSRVMVVAPGPVCWSAGAWPKRSWSGQRHSSERDRPW